MKNIYHKVCDSVWESVRSVEISMDGIIFYRSSVWDFVDDSITKSVRFHVRDSTWSKLREYKF